MSGDTMRRQSSHGDNDRRAVEAGRELRAELMNIIEDETAHASALQQKNVELKREIERLKDDLSREQGIAKEKQQRYEDMKKSYAELERDYRQEKEAHKKIYELKEVLEEESKERAGRIQDLQYQVEELKEKANAPTVSAQDIMEWVARFGGGLQDLSSSEAARNTARILDRLDELHDKVDDMSTKIGDVHCTTGFLASMSVRMSRVLDTIVDDEMEMPRLLRLVPVDVKKISKQKIPKELLNDLEPPKLERKKGRTSLKKKFTGKAGAASRMVKKKIPHSAKGEEWKVEFLCSHNLEPVDVGIRLKVPGFFMINAYPIMKVMCGLLTVARVVSATVDRLVENAGIGDLPSQNSVRSMREMVLNFERQNLNEEQVKDIDGEIDEQLDKKNPTGIREVAPEMYQEIKRLMENNHPEWRTMLNAKMRRVVGEDARVHWVAHENLSQFTSPEASQQRMLCLQEDHTRRLVEQHMRSLQNFSSQSDTIASTVDRPALTEREP